MILLQYLFILERNSTRWLLYLLIPAVFFSSCKSKTLFVALSPGDTGIRFENRLAEKKLFNFLYYLYYYNGAGVGVGDINNDGLPDIYFAANNKGQNKLYLNKGNFKFEDITEKAGVKGSADWCTGVTMADVNNDGLLDIYVSAVSKRYGLKGHNELFINNGNATFTEKSAAYNLAFEGTSTQTAFFDYDRDGDLDCYMLNQSQKPHSNIRDTSFRHGYDSISGDRLYRNDLATLGKFTEVSKEAGIYQSSLGYGLGIAISDFNNDGWDDIYIGNDFHENDYYYINRGNGTFSEEGAQHFRHYSRFSMGNDAADFNNDGQVDIVTLDMLPPSEKILKTYGSDENADIYKLKLTTNGYQDQYSRNCLQLNNGNGVSYSDVGLQAGVAATDWSWAPLFADFDNDGKKDLFITSGIVKRPMDLDYMKFLGILKSRGLDKTDKYDDSALLTMPDGAGRPYFFKNQDGLNFKDVSGAWGTGSMSGYYNGAAYADLDNDGRLDMVVNCINEKALILKNNSPAKNYISIFFAGDSTNKPGLGAKAYVYTGAGFQFQQLMPSRGFMSSVDYRLHFGLDSVKNIDSILVVWPDQHFHVLRQVPANQELKISKKNAVAGFRYADFFPPVKEWFTDVTDSIALPWVHRENDFVDYNLQYLIPHAQSTRGPKIAVADVNGDGLDDFYVCGAKNQPGALMIQQKSGRFLASDTALMNAFAICEDVDAIFFDANGDKHPDLWVVSGGNELPTNKMSNIDRLYLNDGTGHFTFSPKAFQQQFYNKSCIAVADIDKDGDTDVFIGHLSDQQRFGQPMSSYLYINNGKGDFSIAPVETMNLLNTGMVITAAFADLNKDGWPDLVLAGEWMPLKVFINHNGTFKSADINASTGLWQTLFAADVNGDGATDLLAGNWGHNSKLWAGKNGPLKLYVSDFDHNASLEQIMCYTIDGKEYTFLGKDELEKALPVLKKAYLTYDEVAGETVQYMFYDLFKEYKEYKAEVLGSSCFMNDGKGNFSRTDLPDELQFAPVMAFTLLKDGFFMGAGNFYGVIPYEGRYDALLPSVFSFSGNHFSRQAIIPNFAGEARDVKWLQAAGGKKLLMIAANNGPVKFYRYNPPAKP